MSSGDPKVTLPSTPATEARPSTATDPFSISRVTTPPVLVTTMSPVAVTGPRVRTSPFPVTVVVVADRVMARVPPAVIPEGAEASVTAPAAVRSKSPSARTSSRVPPVRDSRVPVPSVPPTLPDTSVAVTVTTVPAPVPWRVTRRSPARVTPPGITRLRLPPRLADCAATTVLPRVRAASVGL